jgi:hypothetical protein
MKIVYFTQDRITEKHIDKNQEKRHITAVWRNGGCCGIFNISNSNKHLCLVDSEVLLNPPLRQAAIRQTV